MNQSPQPDPTGDIPPTDPRSPRRRRDGARNATRRMVTCAILCALSVVILTIGRVLEIIDLTSAALAAIIILLIYLCYGTRYALLSYAVTGVLAAILLPESWAAWSYLGLMGYYPILKQQMDRLPKVLSWVLKILLFAVIMAGCMLVFHFLIFGGQGSILDSFLKAFDEESGKPLMAWAIVGLSLFTYVIFDILLDRLTILYRLRFYKVIEKWMKP